MFEMILSDSKVVRGLQPSLSTCFLQSWFQKLNLSALHPRLHRKRRVGHRAIIREKKKKAKQIQTHCLNQGWANIFYGGPHWTLHC